jgi:Ca2+/Na+ antiporter
MLYFILLFTILPILNSDWQTTSPESNAVQKAIYLYHKPLLWFLFAGFALIFSIELFAGKIHPLHAGFWGMLAILLFYNQLKK